MALPKPKFGCRLMSVVLSASVALLGCSGRGGPTGGGGEAALSDVDDASACGQSTVGKTPVAYWVVDRIEDGAAGGGGIAVLENIGELRTEERSVKELPAGVKEGQALAAGAALRIDKEVAATRAALILERFERLK